MFKTKRPTIPAAEEILNGYFPVLDHGFVALVDYLGGDQAIERSARTSYGFGTRQTSETRGLLRYLRRHDHTSPSEFTELVFHLAMPIFVARQWVRHRTACLAGDTLLHFDLPGGVERRGNQLYTLTIKEVYERFQPTRNNSRPDKQGNPYFKRDRVKNMLLRSLNEETGEVYHTRIVDVWESGVKPVFAVTLENGVTVRMSKDHRCFTDNGWKRLEEIDPAVDRIAYIGPMRNVAVVPEPVEADPEDEQWAPVRGYEGLYEVSTYGRVRRLGRGKGSRAGRIKKQSIRNGRAVVSLSSSGVTRTYHVHRLVLEAFVGSAEEGQECRHLDGNSLNNRLVNLQWGTPKENSEDAKRLGTTTRLGSTFYRIVEIRPDGEDMTYDIEVEGPYHNFSANGMVVHNSINEYSGRYSLMPLLFYTPDREHFALQSKSNKQGRGELADEGTYKCAIAQWSLGRTIDQHNYEWLTGEGVARELARIDLPLSTYTFFYWKIDLHNLLHFLRLRCDSHAQYEIRAYAEKIAGIVKRVAPLSYEAWIDYNFAARKFSYQELQILSSLVTATEEVAEPARISGVTPSVAQERFGLSEREWSEFVAKLQPLPRPDFELDLSEMKDASYFEERIAAAVPVSDRR